MLIAVFFFSVLSSCREPVAGWVDNWNGPTGIIAAAGKGFFRTMLCHENKIADLVPVDVVINLMICAAWRTATVRYIAFIHTESFIS